MAKSEFHLLLEKYPDIFDNPSRLPTLVRQIALFVQQELEQDTNGEEIIRTEGLGNEPV